MIFGVSVTALSLLVSIFTFSALADGEEQFRETSVTPNPALVQSVIQVTNEESSSRKYELVGISRWGKFPIAVRYDYTNRYTKKAESMDMKCRIYKLGDGKQSNFLVLKCVVGGDWMGWPDITRTMLNKIIAMNPNNRDLNGLVGYDEYYK